MRIYLLAAAVAVAAVLSLLGVVAFIRQNGTEQAAQARTPRAHHRDTRRCAAGGVLGTFGELGGVGLPPGMNPARFDLRTIWIRDRPRLLQIVYAGATLAPTRRAGLSLLFVNPRVGLPTRGSGFYPFPRTARFLTLTCVRGTVLSVQYPNGTATFDLRTRRWGFPA